MARLAVATWHTLPWQCHMTRNLLFSKEDGKGATYEKFIEYIDLLT